MWLAQSVDPVSVSTSIATFLKGDLLHIFANVAGVAILVLAAILGVTLAGKLIRRWMRA